MVVRELITKISFAVNRGGLDAANNGISRLKRSLGGIGGASSMASRMFGNSAANTRYSFVGMRFATCRSNASRKAGGYFSSNTCCETLSQILAFPPGCFGRRA